MPKFLNVNPAFRTRKWLKQKYLKEKLSSQQIADIIGVDRKTIDLWLKKVNLVKPAILYRDKQWLFQKYWVEKLSLPAIGKVLNVDYRNVRRWFIRYSIPLRTRKEAAQAHRGKNNQQWRGGKYSGSDGYIYVREPGHPNCDNQGYVKQHRLIIEKKLGRYLFPKEVIHHINRKRNDNRLSNLYLFPSQRAHMIYHAAAQAKKAPKYLKSNFKEK